MPKLTELQSTPAFAPGDLVYVVADGVSSKLASLRVPNIAAMTAIAVPLNGMSVEVTEGGRGGLFVFDTSVTATGNTGTTFSAGDATTGSWVRQFSGPIDVRWFNADSAGVIDATAEIQAAIDAAAAAGGGTVTGVGTYVITGTLLIPEAVNLVGQSVPHIFSTTFPGFVLEYSGAGAAVQIGDGSTKISGVRVENVCIRDIGGTGTAGLVVGGLTGSSFWTHDITLQHVIATGFTAAFKIEKAYAINATLCTSNNARSYGWHFTAQSGSLTLSDFTSCGSYNAGTASFFIERSVTYSSFNQCYSDGAPTGFSMTGFCPGVDLFINCGVENFTVNAFYISEANIRVGIVSPVIINDTPLTTTDNIYFSGNTFYLTSAYIPSAYQPSSTGVDVNIATGRGVFTRGCRVNSVSGDYEGRWGISALEVNGGAISTGALALTVPAGAGAYTQDVRNTAVIYGQAESQRRVAFSQMQAGQVLTIYGADEADKFLLDNFDFPKLAKDIYLGPGDFAKMVYDDLDGTGAAWWLLELKIDRFGSTAPASGYWEVGRIFWNTAPAAAGKVGWVCTAAGSPGTWKPFGAIDA